MIKCAVTSEDENGWVWLHAIPNVGDTFMLTQVKSYAENVLTPGHYQVTRILHHVRSEMQCHEQPVPAGLIGHHVVTIMLEPIQCST